jgi:hypothetical protein
MWSNHPDYEKVIIDSWNVEFPGCAMSILSKKLKLVKDNLKVWNKSSFGNVHDSVTAAENNLNHIHDQILDIGPSDELLDAEKLAHASLESALNNQETFWKEKANLNWHLHGNRNTKFFHRSAKIKTSSKMITSLQDGEHVLTDKAKYPIM